MKDLQVKFPIYIPDATRGVVRSLDSQDLKSVGIEGVVVNTYHLMSEPGTTLIKQAGGIKKFMNFAGLVASDSGGFQLLSLIYRQSSFGKISDDGVIFYRGTKGNQRHYYFTPEKSIQVQMTLQSDIVICLDDCPAKNAKDKEVELSVQRTISWAKRSKQEFQRLLEINRIPANQQPWLLAVVQGQKNKALRQYCGQELQKIGFDAYGFGGWPIDEQTGQVDLEILDWTRKQIPRSIPMFALGVGNPAAIVDGYQIGYQIFDCVLPTRDARHQRLYVFKDQPTVEKILKNDHFYQFIEISKEIYARDFQPISQFCDCPTCQRYSRAYLHHLFKIEDALAWRLATIHNLRTYSKLIEILRQSVIQSY